MPKRKALGVIDDSSDDEEYSSYPPKLGSLRKNVLWNFHTGNGASTASTSGFGSAGPSTSTSCVGGTQGLTAGSTTAVEPVDSESRKFGFAEKMNDLNTTFLRSCQATISKNPSDSLVPLVKDYLHYSRELLETKEQQTLGNSFQKRENDKNRSFISLGEFFEDFEQKFVTGIMPRANQTSSPSPAPTSRPSVTDGTPSFASTPQPIQSTGASNPVSHFVNALNMKYPVTSSKPVASSSFQGFSFLAPPPSIPSTSSALQASLPTAPAPRVMIDNDNNVGEQEDADEPPKNDFTPVTESDVVYSTKCKVFGMTDGIYKDKGVGTLFLKKVEGGKYQIVVRADNNLGTIILNILLQKSLPLGKKSAKDVMTMDLRGNKEKGMPILLRLKSEDEADDLLRVLKEFKQLIN